MAAHATYYAEIVRDKATQRELIHASTEILRDAWDPTLETREVLNQAEEKIFAVHDRRSSDQVTSIHDVLMEAFDAHRRPDGAWRGLGSPPASPTWTI